jgi:hypothetical protein
MAKKKISSRRVSHSATPRTFGDGLPSPAAEATTAAAVRPAGRPAPVAPQTSIATRRPAPVRSGEARAQAPLSEEYHYIGSDLRRLGILAVSTFVLMIILGIVVH